MERNTYAAADYSHCMGRKMNDFEEIGIKVTCFLSSSSNALRDLACDDGGRGEHEADVS